MDYGQAFLENQATHASRVRAKSLAANTELVAIRSSILDAAIKLKQKANGKQYRPKDARMHLIAQYLQGVVLSYNAIIDGLYAQAAALQKQQLESIVRLEEYRFGNQKDGRTPNIQNSGLRGFKEQYKALNGVAHPSIDGQIEGLNHFTEREKQGPTTTPDFNEEVCRVLLGNHCLYLLHLWRHMSHFFTEEFETELVPEEYKGLESAIRSLIDLGFLRYDGV